MGVHVILDIDPDEVDPDAWGAAYDETLALLEAWRPRLLGWGVRWFEGSRVGVYARSIRRDDGDQGPSWCVVGDRDSMRTAECQSLYRNITRYSSRRGKTPGRGGDIVVTAADASREHTGGPVRVFGDKTQGHPYHHAVLAAAMIIEERFAGSAMVSGDIDRGQAEEARRIAAPILGRELALPVRVDAARLIERLRARYDDDALPGAFHRVFLGEDGEGFEAMLRAFPNERGAREWLRAIARHATPDSVGVVLLLIAWLNAGRDLREACRLACVAPEGPGYSPEGFIDALAATWVAVPRPVRASLDVLRKPKGTSSTVATLLGSFLLDMAAVGRRLRIHIEPATIAAGLSEVFGTQGPMLATRLDEASTRVEAELRVQAADLSNFFAEAAEHGDDDVEALAALGSSSAMGESQRTAVRGMAWSTMSALTQLRGDPKLASALVSADQARRLLVRVLADRGPTLSEGAWDAIVSESDPEVLAWWVGLVSLDAGLHASHVRRAFFENAEIRRHAIAIGHDKHEMKEIGELVGRARKR